MVKKLGDKSEVVDSDYVGTHRPRKELGFILRVIKELFGGLNQGNHMC